MTARGLSYIFKSKKKYASVHTEMLASIGLGLVFSVVMGVSNITSNTSAALDSLLLFTRKIVYWIASAFYHKNPIMCRVSREYICTRSNECLKFLSVCRNLTP